LQCSSREGGGGGNAWNEKILERVSKMPFQAGRRIPQELKPAFLLAHGGTAEAVPYPKPIFETRSISKLFCDLTIWAPEMQCDQRRKGGPMNGPPSVFSGSDLGPAMV